MKINMKEKTKNWSKIIFILTIFFIIVAILLLVLDFSGRIHLPQILNSGLLFALLTAIVYPLKRFFRWPTED